MARQALKDDAGAYVARRNLTAEELTTVTGRNLWAMDQEAVLAVSRGGRHCALCGSVCRPEAATPVCVTCRQLMESFAPFVQRVRERERKDEVDRMRERLRKARQREEDEDEEGDQTAW